MSLYWRCQLGGWSAMVVWSMAVSTFLGRTSWNGLLLSVAASASGLLLTHVFRKVIHRGGWKELPPARLAPRVFAACAGLGLVTGVLTLPLLLPMLPAEAATAEILLTNVVSSGFLFVGWFLLYFSYHYFQRGRRAQEAEWRLRVAMRENELRTLRAQLNPHFLFNSLNSLRGLISESPERAQEAVTSLASLLRHTLRLSSAPLAGLELELEAARHYLELEHIRFEDRLAYRFEVDPELRDQAVPPMLLQNLLENAIKHGISRRRQGGRILVEVREEGAARVLIRVTNPGQLEPSEGEPGLGLANARNQLHLLFPGESELLLRSPAPDQVECLVRLPRRRMDTRRLGEREMRPSPAGTVEPA